MADAPLLNPDLLRDLEGKLVGIGIPVEDWTNPGLSANEITERVKPLGLRLPDEAVVWWGWRNGANEAGRDKVLPRWHNFLSLDGAVRRYRQSRQVAIDCAPDYPHGNPDLLWDLSWLPLDDVEHGVVIDCTVGPGARTPVRFVDPEDPEGSHRVRAPSLGQVVTWWCHAIEIGAWVWASDRECWLPHWDLLGEEERKSGVV